MSHAFVYAGGISVIVGIVLVVIGVKALFNPTKDENCDWIVSLSGVRRVCTTNVLNNGPILIVVGAALIIAGALIMR